MRKLLLMDELSYIPNGKATAMVGGTTMTTGVLVPNMDNSLFMRIVQAINDTTCYRDYTLLVMDSRGEPHREAKNCEEPKRPLTLRTLSFLAGLYCGSCTCLECGTTS